jgi:hypothetical protein
MKRGIMALEGLNEEVVVPETDPAEMVSPEAVELAEVSAEVEVEAADIEEAQDAVETLTDFIEILEEKVADAAPAEPEVPAIPATETEPEVPAVPAKEEVPTPEGLDEDAAEVLAAAVEGICIRLRIPKSKRRAMPAMEAFGSKQSRVQASKLALENIKQNRTSTEAYISVAQEGFIDKLKNETSLLFSNEKKLATRLKTTSAEFDSKGASDKMITAPAWGAQFGISGKELVTGKDVIAAATQLAKIADSAQLTKTIKAISAEADKVLLLFTKAPFISDEKTSAKLKSFEAELQKSLQTVKESISESKEDIKTTNFAPLNEADKKKLVSELDTLAGNKSVSEALDALYDTLMAKSMANNPQFGGIFAKNSKEAYKAIQPAWDAYQLVNGLMYQNIKFMHASVAYIAASTK